MATDQQVLELRRRGRSFAGIARELEFARASDAVDAYDRAIVALPETEQSAVRAEEAQRLEALATRVHDDDSLAQDTRDRQMRTIAALRRRLAP